MLYEQIAMNKRRTGYVMAGFGALVLAVGAALGDLFWGSWQSGCLGAAIVTVVYMAIMIGNSTNVVMSMNHAREIRDEQQAPQLWHLIEDMALVGQVPMPRVFIIDDASPNAFATGNNPEHSAVAVTTGLLERLNREELEGVIGHEVSHIRNYDIRLQTIALALSAAIGFLVNFASNWFWWGGGRRRDDDDDSAGNIIGIVVSIFLVLLAPLAASIAQMALSRNREYLADAASVELTRNPQGLISALEKIDDSQPMQAADPNSAALYISDPFKQKRKMADLFATHPPIADRIARLQKM
ncbi:zinc metalloprotease HtpX [Levilactobacillus spicheri]|jgi:Zn-dependent protease with chaperone function|uniref:Protease HtpX homolog n=2 Tax=Levilactobacillus spicheri TaxID=216463 RepID=A0A0F3RSH4_9LACO|nr:zinc metalloprotease HtpX [Levilactobacillus spicheri]KJW12941.1 heat shock protein HtpX [Levilactobacillus spicheri]KRL49059.1 heat shock protein HtpX [Levilactobacillus spicheri DSM 15429]GEO67358.1 protease HtpX [Levilactobacillus spicheri]